MLVARGKANNMVGQSNTDKQVRNASLTGPASVLVFLDSEKSLKGKT